METNPLALVPARKVCASTTEPLVNIFDLVRSQWLGLYEVNTTLFPDMDGFLDWVHAKGLKIFFNDHPKWLDVNTSGAGSSDPAVVVDPKEIQFRYTGLSGLMYAFLTLG